MKKITIAIGCFLLAATAGFSQKMLSTKSAAVSFLASGGAERIAAENNEVDCKLLPTTGQMVFTLLVKGFRFENQLMEDHFNENYVESSKFPKAGFKGYITNIAAINFAKDGTYKAEAEGTLNMHGVDQKVKTAGTVTVSGGKVTLKGDFKINLKDYKITGAYIGDKIAPNVSISVNCKF